MLLSNFGVFMGKTFILTRAQRIPCCRINSVYAAAYILNHPVLFQSQRPKLSVHLQRLNMVIGVMNAVEADLGNGYPALTALNKIMSEQKWLSEPEIQGLNLLIKENEPIRKAIGNYADIKSGNPADPFGLLVTYAGMDDDERQYPELNNIEKIIYFSEKYFYENHARAQGLEHGEAVRGINSAELLQNLGSLDYSINLSKPTTVYRSEAAQYIQNVFDDAQSETLIQVTTGGHSTVFGKKDGKYWHFDSLGHATIGEGECVCATLTVFDSKQEALDAMTKITAKTASEFSVVNLTPSPAAILATQRAAEAERARVALTREIAGAMEQLQKIQQAVGTIHGTALPERSQAYQQQQDAIEALEFSVKTLQIPKELKPLVESHEAIMLTLSSEKEKQAKLLKDFKQVDMILEQSNHMAISQTLETTDAFKQTIEALEANIAIYESMLQGAEISHPALKEEVKKHCLDNLLMKVFLPLADAAVTLTNHFLRRSYHDDQLPEYYGQIETLDLVIKFLEDNEEISASQMMHAVIDDLKKLRTDLIEKLPADNRATFKHPK